MYVVVCFWASILFHCSVLYPLMNITFYFPLLVVQLLSRVQLFVTPLTAACQAPLPMRFSRQEYWSGLPCPPLGDLPNPGTEPRSPAFQVDSFTTEPSGKPNMLLLKWKLLSCVRFFVTPWTIHSMEFSGPEYWNCPSPGDLPNPGIEPRSLALQADSLPAELQGKPKNTGVGSLCLLKRAFPTRESNWKDTAIR